MGSCVVSKHTTFFVCLIFVSSCASYYQLNYEFNRNFETGELEEAERILAENKKAADSKSKFLYYLNRGTVASLLGNYEESNEFLEKAYLFGEDYYKNYLNEALSYITNPSVIEYKGEDHEHLMLLYYKALNFLKMGDYEAALVECRRLNNRLNELSDRYKSEKKYQRDAFINNLVGIIYEAAGDYNYAFIAYRNSLEIYEEDYQELFQLSVPDQLKHDLIRSAYLTGFYDEVQFYEDKFGIDFNPDKSKGGDLVFFWHNGLGPVKSEWSVNFAINKGDGGAFVLDNDQYGFSFPFYDLDLDDEDQDNLTDLSVFRVAFPKYVERPPMFSSATLKYGGKMAELELTQNVNDIAFKVLKERMLLEFSRSLIRVAIKKAAEKKLRDENEGLGTVLGVVNAATEKADTRNWQTLPHSIYYTRLKLKPGKHEVTLTLNSPYGHEFDQKHIFSFDIENNETQFHSFQSLEISPNYMGRGYR